MFKLESYITPIILSQVERYVKNVRAEESQISLWGGDAVFSNLDLRLDVLEEELRLPFSLVSGHIHELHIHVPWTRLHSEPIVLTINTIECVLKLPTDRASSVSEVSDVSSAGPAGDRRKKAKEKVEVAPPGYIQGLVNKIISNIQVVCNNLIVKYVEDDMVLSLNVRTASLVSADEAWSPSFTELSLPDLILRKLVTVSDLTVCLDRRGALGKIEVYQDPLLYRCSLTVRAAWCYAALTAKVPFRSVFNVLAEKMEFSITGVQVPMVMRLAKLLLALYYGEMSHQQVEDRRKRREGGEEVENKDDEEETVENEDEESIGGLVWNIGSAVGSVFLPVYWEDENQEEIESSPLTPKKASSEIGLYIGEATVTLKVAVNVKQKGFYGGSKQSFTPYLCLAVQGIYCEIGTQGLGWIDVNTGVSQITVRPVGDCPGCGEKDQVQQTYLLSGCEGNRYLTGSLFEADRGAEEIQVPRELANIEDKSWEGHMEDVTETSLLDRTAALAMDYVYCVELPEEFSSETLSEFGSDMEHSNLPERALCRVIVGPSQVSVCSGSVHRALKLHQLSKLYDYQPYVGEKCDPEPEGLNLPTKDEIDQLENNTPVRTYRLTILHPSVTISSADDLVGVLKEPVRIEAGIRCVDLVNQVPMYPLRNVKAASVMHPPSRTILNNCHSSNNMTLQDTWIKLTTGQYSANLLRLDKLSVTNKNLLFKQFWKNLYQKHGDASCRLESLALSSSRPQLALSRYTIESLYKPSEFASFLGVVSDCLGKQPPVVSCLITGTVVSWTWTSQIYTFSTTIESAAISIISSPGSSKTKSLPILNGHPSHAASKLSRLGKSAAMSPGKALPEKNSGKDKSSWLVGTLQVPCCNSSQFVPTVVHLVLADTAVTMDPSLSEVLMYKAMQMEMFKKEGTPGKSESMSFKNFKHSSAQLAGQKSTKEGTAVSEETWWLSDLSGTIIDIKTKPITVYLPEKSLAFLSGQTVQENVSKATKSKTDISVIAIQFPSVSVGNVGGRVDLEQYQIHPILFPPALWTAGKDNFPWSIKLADFCIRNVSGLGGSDCPDLLAPVTTNCTFGMTNKSSNDRVNLAFCVHADMTPVEFFLNIQLIESFVRVLQTLLQLSTLLIPTLPPENISPVPSCRQPAPMPTIIQRSLGSVSENLLDTTLTRTSGVGSDKADETSSSKRAFSLWLQWTIPQWSTIIVTGSEHARSKLLLSLEDTSASIDSQGAYTKLKFRILSANADHFVEKSPREFVPSSFPGKVLTSQLDTLSTLYAFSPQSSSVEILSEEDEEQNNILSKGLFNLVVTKAECQNVYKKLKYVMKEINMDGKFGVLSTTDIQNCRYLTEFDIEMNPFDIFLRSDVIESLLETCRPFASLKFPEKKNNEASLAEMAIQLNNNNLPMLYVKSQRVRVFVHLPRKKLKIDDSLVPDFFLCQIKNATVTSQVDNPLSRILVEAELYHQADNSRMLAVPGAYIEDRQYQADFRGITIATGNWDVVVERNKKPVKTVLRTMSENPALEWNLAKQEVEEMEEVVLVPILYDARVKLSGAPAIVYKKIENNTTEDILVAGISAEVNATTDLTLCFSLQQMQFLSAIQNVFLYAATGKGASKDVNTNRTSVTDSGVDCTSTSSGIVKTELQQHITFVPFELLLTCNSIRLALHKFERSDEEVTEGDVKMWRKYHHGDRKTNLGRKLSEDSNITEGVVKDRELSTLDIGQDTSTEVGYDASEEESVQETKKVGIRLIPLISVTLTHPHIFASLNPNSQKVDVSVYDFVLCGTPESYHLPANSGKKMPTTRDFPIHLVETKPGRPDPKSGIRPALMTATFSDILSGTVDVNVKVERPVKVLISEARYKEIQSIKEQVSSLLLSDSSELIAENKTSCVDYLRNLRNVCLETEQLVLDYDTKDNERCYCARLSVASTSCKTTLTNLPDNDTKLKIEANVERLALSLGLQSVSHSLLDPVSASVLLNTKLSPNLASKNTSVLIKSEQVSVHVGPNIIFCLEILKNSLFNLMIKAKGIEELEEAREEIAILEEVSMKLEDEQHYQDDLRAGAFQFISGEESEPAPYQIVFTKDPPAMTWKYPQPRTLTRVVIFPVPFLEASVLSDDRTETVDCELEYWSDSLQCYTVYQKFQLSESKVVHLDLPLITNRKTTAVSSTWRVRLHSVADSAILAPQSLVSVMKVDSYYSSRMLPSSQVSINVSAVTVHLHNHLHFCGRRLSGSLSHLGLIDSFPLDQQIITLAMRPTTAAVSMFTTKSGCQFLQCQLKTKLFIEYMDYTFLATHTLLLPADIHATLQIDQTNSNAGLDTSVIVDKIDVSGGLFLYHNLQQSLEIWKHAQSNLSQNYSLEKLKEMALPIPTQFLVGNETQQHVRFGQADTDENILLLPRHCSMYAWRSQRATLKLRLGIEGLKWEWSQPFGLSIGDHVVSVVTNNGDKAQLVVQVTKISATQTMVSLCGLLNLSDMLQNHLEVRLVPHKHKEVRCLLGSYDHPTSLVTPSNKDAVLKIRLFGIGTPWSGDIPLDAPMGKKKSFMVKLPLKEKGQSVTIWCSILTETIEGFKRQLVIFSPMYVVKSHLPNPVVTHVNYPNSEQDFQLIIDGRGSALQLDVPAAPETKFKLSFQLATGMPPSSPPLDVSWGIIDQVRDKSSKLPSINEVVNKITSYSLKVNACSRLYSQISTYKVMDQPKTDVNVSFSEYHPVTNTLCIKVQPRYLIINETGIPILTKVGQSGPSWLLDDKSIFQPPPLTSTFYIGLMDVRNEEIFGAPLELSDQDWTYLSIRPSIQGVLPAVGNLRYQISVDDHTIVWFTILSDVLEGVKLLKVRPMFLLANQADRKLTIKPLIHQYTSLVVTNPKSSQVVKEDLLEILPQSTSACVPVLQWTQPGVGKGQATPYLQIQAGGIGWSYPVLLPLDKDIRECVTAPIQDSEETNIPLIIISHQVSGQVYISIKPDVKPQLKLISMINIPVYFRQENPVPPRILTRSLDILEPGSSCYFTMPWLNAGFPFLEQNKHSRKLELAIVAPQEEAEWEMVERNSNWSAGVDVTATQETFVNLPGYGDVKILVESFSQTTFIYIEPVSSLEIAARDIRARFTSVEEPELNDTAYYSPEQSVDMSLKSFTSVNDAMSRQASFATVDSPTSPLQLSRPASVADSLFSLVPKVSSVSYTGPTLILRVGELTLALNDDLLECVDLQEVARVTLVDIGVRCMPKVDYSTMYRTLGGQHLGLLDLKVTVGDLQIDNQMINRGLYSFPVVLSSQVASEKRVEGGMVDVNVSYTRFGDVMYTKELIVNLQPIAMHLEDTFIYKMHGILAAFSNYSKLEDVEKKEPEMSDHCLPPEVIFAVQSASQIAFIDKFAISPVWLRLTIHASIRVFLGLQESEVCISDLDCRNVWATWYSLGHRLSRHYLSGALFRAGWVVGSLDMIGSPAGFTRTVTDGVKDFVSLPYNGMFYQGVWGFVVGCVQGSSSLVKHVSAGTVTSVTNFASSLSRNLDRMSFDTEHRLRNEEIRRQRPSGLGEGLSNGLSGVGVSILGAIGGIAHHPIQVLVEEGLSPMSLVSGVGKGIAGVVTKPLGSAAELVAQTGQGLLTGSGWAKMRKPRVSRTPGLVMDLASSVVKLQWKLVWPGSMVTSADATLMQDDGQYMAVVLVLTSEAVCVVSEDEDAVMKAHGLGELKWTGGGEDPTLAVLEVEKVDTIDVVQDRVTQFVLDSINYAGDGGMLECAETSGEKFLFYMSPTTRSVFGAFFQQTQDRLRQQGFMTV